MEIKRRNSAIGLIALSIIGYLSIGYYIPRTDFYSLFSIYTVLFAIYIFILAKPINKDLYTYYFTGAILIRLGLVFAIPSLSDDFYRFFWDGEMMHQGINPYTHLPNEIVHQFKDSENIVALFDGMNSKNYFSVYPPMAQFSYYLATFFSDQGVYNAIIIYKILILCTELALIPVMIRMLEKLNKRKELVFFYLLNPLIILEFSGNLHGEVFVILGLMIASCLLLEKIYNFAAIIFGLTISFKLLPLIFLPLVIRFIGLKNGFRFSLISIIVFLLTFIPFIDKTFIHHIAESLGLYFNVFEFNSSISKILRSISNWLFGDSNTTLVGRLSGITSFVFILIYSFKSLKNDAEGLFKRMSFLLLVYLIFAMSIHPWYITPLVAFGVFIPLHYGIIWSFFIFVTYITYNQFPYSQNSYLIALEYIMLLIVFVMYRKRAIEIT